jgi:hypothetical protein
MNSLSKVVVSNAVTFKLFSSTLNSKPLLKSHKITTITIGTDSFNLIMQKSDYPKDSHLHVVSFIRSYGNLKIHQVILAIGKRNRCRLW